MRDMLKTTVEDRNLLTDRKSVENGSYCGSKRKFVSLFEKL